MIRCDWGAKSRQGAKRCKHPAIGFMRDQNGGFAACSLHYDQCKPHFFEIITREEYIVSQVIDE